MPNRLLFLLLATFSTAPPKSGVFLDVRKPNVTRLAPVPLYNTFKDVHEIVGIMRRIVADLKKQKK